MRSLVALLCFLTLVVGGDGGDRLLAATSAGLSVERTPQPTPQVIRVGEEVTGTLQPCCIWGPAVFEMLFELTAPSDGTLVVHLSSGAHLVLEDVYWWPMWRSPRVLSTIATRQVTAGQTYRLWVYEASWDLYEQVPFVLTTSIESGPVTLPPACEFAPPGTNWVCVNGGWVPEDHPLAIANPPTSPAPPVPPPPASEPPVVGPTGCTTVKPAETWICVSGAWLPADHPLAVGGPTNPTPPSPPPTSPPPPVPPTGCAGPDPFDGIPGLIGVCVNGGWIPLGHPLTPPSLPAPLAPPPPSGIVKTYTWTVSSSDTSGPCAGVPDTARRRVCQVDSSEMVPR